MISIYCLFLKFLMKMKAKISALGKIYFEKEKHFLSVFIKSHIKVVFLSHHRFISLEKINKNKNG